MFLLNSFTKLASSWMVHNPRTLSLSTVSYSIAIIYVRQLIQLSYQIVSGHCDQIESKTGSEDDGKDEGRVLPYYYRCINGLHFCVVILPLNHNGLGCEEKLILDNVRSFCHLC